MVHAIMLVLAVLQPPTPPDPRARAAELKASAQAHHDAEEFVAAAEDYLTLSSLPDVDRDDANQRAHMAFESAYLASSTTDIGPMCRALELARRIVRSTREGPVRQSWEETVAEDRRLLGELGEKRCPAPRPQVKFLMAEGGMQLPSQAEGHKGPPPPPKMTIVRLDERRLRVRTTAGATLVGLGVGFTALMGVALDIHRRRHDEIRAVADLPDGVTAPPDQQARLPGALAEAKAARAAAIGLGVAGGAMLATGIGLLTSVRKARRAVAFSPYGGPLGGGAVVRLHF